MLDKYITIAETGGVAGQDARTKEWYCKELPFKDEKDLDTKIAKINRVCNKYNKVNSKKEKVPPPTPGKGKM